MLFFSLTHFLFAFCAFGLRVCFCSWVQVWRKASDFSLCVVSLVCIVDVNERVVCGFLFGGEKYNFVYM
jgi:hypothetical protein